MSPRNDEGAGVARVDKRPRRRALVWFGLGLAIQGTIVGLAVTGRARTQAPAPSAPAIRLPSGLTVSSTITSAANAPVGGVWTPQVRFDFDLGTRGGVITDAILVGEMGPGLELFDLETSQGFPIFGPDGFSLVLEPSPANPTTVLTYTMGLLQEGPRAHRLSLQLPGAGPVVFTDLVVAELPPLTFDVRQVRPGFVQLGDVYDFVWKVGSAQRVITDTILTGSVQGGILLSVITDRGLCSTVGGRTTFGCSLGLIDTDLGTTISITAQAIAPANNDHHVLIRGGGEQIVISNTVTVQPLACDVDLDADVDRNDLTLILGARNTPATGPQDPRDADGDGRITVLDARRCTLLCTRPRCATN